MGITYFLLDSSFNMLVKQKGLEYSCYDKACEFFVALAKHISSEPVYLDSIRIFRGTEAIELDEAAVFDKISDLASTKSISTQNLVEFWNNTCRSLDVGSTVYIFTGNLDQTFSMESNIKSPEIFIYDFSIKSRKVTQNGKIRRMFMKNREMEPLAEKFHKTHVRSSFTVFNCGVSTAGVLTDVWPDIFNREIQIRTINVLGVAAIREVDAIPVYKRCFFLPIDPKYNKASYSICGYEKRSKNQREAVKPEDFDNGGNYAALCDLFLEMKNIDEEEETVILGTAEDVHSQRNLFAVFRARTLNDRFMYHIPEPEESEKPTDSETKEGEEGGEGTQDEVKSEDVKDEPEVEKEDEKTILAREKQQEEHAKKARKEAQDKSREERRKRRSGETNKDEENDVSGNKKDDGVKDENSEDKTDESKSNAEKDEVKPEDGDGVVKSEESEVKTEEVELEDGECVQNDDDQKEKGPRQTCIQENDCSDGLHIELPPLIIDEEENDAELPEELRGRYFIEVILLNVDLNYPDYKPFPVKYIRHCKMDREEPSYTFGITAPFDAEAFSAQIHRMIRALRKLSERTAIYEKESQALTDVITYTRNESYAFGFARIFYDEAKFLPDELYKVAIGTAKHFENMGRKLRRPRPKTKPKVQSYFARRFLANRLKLPKTPEDEAAELQYKREKQMLIQEEVERLRFETRQRSVDPSKRKEYVPLTQKQREELMKNHPNFMTNSKPENAKNDSEKQIVTSFQPATVYELADLRDNKRAWINEDISKNWVLTVEEPTVLDRDEREDSYDRSDYYRSGHYHDRQFNRPYEREHHKGRYYKGENPHYSHRQKYDHQQSGDPQHAGYNPHYGRYQRPHHRQDNVGHQENRQYDQYYDRQPERYFNQEVHRPTNHEQHQPNDEGEYSQHPQHGEEHQEHHEPQQSRSHKYPSHGYMEQPYQQSQHRSHYQSRAPRGNYHQNHPYQHPREGYHRQSYHQPRRSDNRHYNARFN